MADIGGPGDAAVRKELAAAAARVDFPTGRGTMVVPEEVIRRLARERTAARGPEAFAAAKRALELQALEDGLCPRRYLRNIATFGLTGQARLLRARVGVAGLGGLGGLAAELLARAGVGELVLVDPDTLSEDNLNRQLLATEDKLGRPKVAAALARLRKVNSAVSVQVHRRRADRESFVRLFAGAAVVVDALDNLPSRFDLQEAARSLDVPLVHGAIAGLSGHLTTIFPADPGLEVLYGPRGGAPVAGVETLVGNPSATPATIAALQVQEVLKILTGVGQPLRRRLLVLDALSAYTAVIEL